MNFNFKSSLLEAFEELDRLQEDTTDKEASKRFWAAAKNNEIDEEAFHAAFDAELDTLGLMDIFNDSGKLKSRGVYEQIKAAKEANPDSWAIKALNKLWVLVYIEQLRYKADKEAVAKREAERVAAAKKREEERQIMIQEWRDLLPAALAEVDKEILDQFLAICKVNINEFNIDIDDSGNVSYLVLKIPSYRAKYRYGIKLAAADKMAELVRVLNHAIKNELSIAKQESNKAIDVFATFIARNNSRGLVSATAHLLGESGTLYTITSDNMSKVNVSDINEPYKVIFVKASESDGNQYTYKNSYSWSYYSWDSSETDKLQKYLPTFGKNSDVWSESETRKVTTPNGNYYSTMDNIDSWAQTRFTSYSTD